MNSAVREDGYITAWTAPEILEGGGTTTREADVFAFGMVVIEVGPRVLPRPVSEVEVRLRLNGASGFYGKASIQRIHSLGHYFKDHQ